MSRAVRALGSPHLGGAGGVICCPKLHSSLTFSHLLTPNNGGFHEIVLAITMEDWLMGFHVTALCVT